MKKINAALVAAVTGAALCVTACGAPKTEPAPEPVQESASVSPDEGTAVMTGGWTIMDEEAGILPGDAQAAFDKAMESYDGMMFKPVALLGTQVVSGTNYMILCRGEQVIEKPVTALYAVTVYEDLDGKASITNVADFDLGAIEEKGSIQPATEILAGGWMAPADTEAEGMLPQEAASAFSACSEGMEYTPVSLLGTKVIAGTEYAILVYAAPESEEETGHYAVMFIAENPDGSYDLMNTVPVDPADYAK